MVEQVASVLWLFGLLGFGGPLIAFSFLLPLAERIGRGEPWHVDRVYRAWGSGSGICLGAIWLGGLTQHYLANDGFHWNVSSPDGQITTIAHLIFLVLWINYTHLEIWVLAPIRKLDPEGGPTDAAAYRAARPRMNRSAAFNAFAFVGFVTLSTLGG